jgi:hypothetical protein
MSGRMSSLLLEGRGGEAKGGGMGGGPPMTAPTVAPLAATPLLLGAGTPPVWALGFAFDLDRDRDRVRERRWEPPRRRGEGVSDRSLPELLRLRVLSLR